MNHTQIRTQPQSLIQEVRFSAAQQDGLRRAEA